MGRIHWLVTGAVWLLASIANADIVKAATELTAEDPNPVTGSKGTGIVVLELDTTLNTLTVRVDFSNLTPTTSAKIHCCGALGSNLPAATMNLASFPVGETHGSTTPGQNTQNTSDRSMWDRGFLGSGTAADAQGRLVSALQNGTAYLAIHTDGYRNGEIRGLLKADPTIADSVRPGNVRMYSNTEFWCSNLSDRCVIPVFANSYKAGANQVVVCDARMDFGPIKVPDHAKHPNKKIRVVWVLVNGEVDDATKYRINPTYGVEITKTAGGEPNKPGDDFNKPGLDDQDERRYKWNSVRKRKDLVFNYKLNAEWYDATNEQWKACGQADPTISNK